ncbi:CAMP factor family pore-forming toxin [Arcanobacterium bovis]|uniref:cAMP factor n=1 Tax=Arcanobacterium bovis TaxID=2529275 RepID=A0A4Q9UZ93_9ACTO|nr:CAMP factor family pore-forming toxin [Arcanobacterium bovis]TBW21039.1 CAMP factor [Arcanobacterium bovis]
MKNPIVSLALATSLIVPGAGVSLAQQDSNLDAAATSAVFTYSSADQEKAKKALADVDAAINKIKKANEGVPQPNWGKEFMELFQTAAELRKEIEAIISGDIIAFDPSTIFARAELVTQVGITIDTAVHTLQNKVQAAHVEIGFSVTKAILRIINFTATEDQLKASKQDLIDTLARVSTYPDLTPGDIATVYVKHELRKDIWQTRINRDANILGKKDFSVYNELNMAITHAVGVSLDPGATVQQVHDEVTALNAAYAKAISAPDKK